jgi:ABC-type branched-subunit amino acid transport system ATPase component
MSAMPILEVESIAVNFEALRALNNVSFSVEKGSITSLVGPNGAGKTTVFNVISGLIRPSSGEIRFEGKRIDRLAPHAVAQAGIGRTFQDPRVFKSMSVLGNALVGARLRASRPFHALLRDRATTDEWNAALTRAQQLLADLGLGDRLNEDAESLSFAEQRFLSLARTLCGEPKVLLLDEPTVGLDQRSIAWFITRLRELIARTGITVLLIEHNMDVVMGISDRVHLLVQGEVVASGATAEIQKHEKMIEAYLGDRYVAASA